MTRHPDTLTPRHPTTLIPPRDRRSRHTFWIDDRIVDTFGPVMGRYACGNTALAVYAVLARRADREGDCWPSLDLIAGESGASRRTVHLALRLLELLGLVEITACYERGSRRQTSNLYTLLTPPPVPPELDPDPATWPPPARCRVLVGTGTRAEAVAAARIAQQTSAVARPAGAEVATALGTATPCSGCTLPHAAVAPPPCSHCTPSVQRLHPPRATAAPLEGNPVKDYPVKESTMKEALSQRKDAEKRDGGAQTTHDGRLTGALWAHDSPSFVIPELGLSNRQVWAAALGELARRGTVDRAELEHWLRPAALIGRDGETLILGAPNAVCRDRIRTRFLPAVRDALSATIGAPVRVEVVVGNG